MKKNYSTRIDYSSIYTKYVNGYQLTKEERKALVELFNARPELKRMWNDERKDNLSSARRGNRPDAGLTNQKDGSNTAKYFKSGEAEFAGRRYTKAQVEDIVRRGAEGSRLTTAEQSIFDRRAHVLQAVAARKEELRKKAETDKANKEAEEKAAEKNRQSAINRLKALAIGNGMPYADYLKSLGLDEKSAANLSAEELTAHEEVLKRRNAALDERAKLKAKTEYENELKRQQQNAQYGLPEDTPLLDNLQLKEIAKGTKAWARDPKAVKRIEEQKAEIMRLFENNEIDEAKRDELLGRLGSQLDAIPYGYVDNPNRRTASQILAEANDNGGFYIDDDGKLQQIESKKDLREQNAQKAIDKLDNARQNKLWEILRKEEEAYNKAHKTDEEKILDEDGKEIDNPYYGKIFDYKARLPQLRAQMDEIFGGAPQEEAPQASMGDLANLSAEANAQFADENADAIVCPECGATFTGDVCPVCGWYAGSAEERNLEAFQNGDEPEFAEEPEAPARHVKKSYL